MFYTFYGDDFTGSTDVLEALARAGIPAALFLAPPTPEDLAGFPNLQALGIAGDSRSRSPEWMSANLPAIFATLKSFGAPVTHYKTCSTFDSAPHIGNIGRAIELGIQVWGAKDPTPYLLLPTPCPFVPIVVGSPTLSRFVLFGNLFAGAGPHIHRSAGAHIHRIDRHPTMSRHPVTPMREADLRRHLALQTDLPTALLALPELTEDRHNAPEIEGFPRAMHHLDEILESRPAAVLFDTYDYESVAAAGALIWHHALQSPLFAVGSSGLTMSLISAWRRAKIFPSGRDIPKPPAPAALDQLLVLSGSCSPITQSQIEHALAHGFHGIPIDPTALIANPLGPLAETLGCIAQGRSPILYTALGPLSPGTRPHAAQLGAELGHLLHEILTHSSIRRTLLCGGDTSSHALQQLPIRALTYAAPLTPGAPLCRAHAPGTPFHRAEFILKGGQIGPTNFFTYAKSGIL